VRYKIKEWYFEMATQERFIKLLATQTDEELEKEIAKMQDNQKNIMIKAFIKMIKGEEPQIRPASKEVRELLGK